MAKCKICGKAVVTAHVFHRECWQEEVAKLAQVFCDNYCRWPRECPNQDELEDKHCDSCDLSLGCGYEHGCSLHGCVIINEALERITMLKEHFSEESALKMAAQALETTPEALRQSAQFHAGDTVWVLTRDEDGVPNDVDGYMFLAVAGNAVIVTSFVDDRDDLDSTLAYHIRETAVNFDSDLAVFPLSDCYAVYEEAHAALDTETEGRS